MELTHVDASGAARMVDVSAKQVSVREACASGVFRTTAEEWQKLLGWRTDMRKRGWKLLRVSSEGPEMVAIFGRTKTDRPDSPLGDR